MAAADNAGRRGIVLWVIAVLLAFVAGRVWTSGPEPAWAQTSPMVGARGVFAFTGQLDRDSFGLFMIDVDQSTLWCYEITRVDGVNKLQLVAGRSWLYDRYLRDFNVADPSWVKVQQLVELERRQAVADPQSPAGAPDPGAP
jgi:hypothetical protein